MATVAVFGSINMDLVAITRRLPEPGETVAGERFLTVPGGKGANQAIAAARAGGRVRMSGAVGTDGFGEHLRATLADSGVDIGSVRRVEGASGTAHIVVDAAGRNCIVVVPGANGTLHALTDADRRGIAEADLVLLQLETPIDGVVDAARFARQSGTRVVLTPAPAQPLPEALLSSVDILVPNEHEARVLTGVTAPEDALRKLAESVPVVVLTRGAEGCSVLERGGEIRRVPSPRVTAVDTTAAGDCFTGAFAVALGEGKSMNSALRWASAAAAISVQHEGASASMPERDRIDALAATCE